jgi:hypothetical protein
MSRDNKVRTGNAIKSGLIFHRLLTGRTNIVRRSVDFGKKTRLRAC